MPFFSFGKFLKYLWLKEPKRGQCSFFCHPSSQATRMRGNATLLKT
ncbi:hypothetical protein [Wolbachia endosymbiont (group A) of Agelastica alni]